MKDQYGRLSLVRLCRLLGLTRQAYYQHGWQQEATGIEESLVLAAVSAIRQQHRAMGGKKLYEKLQPFLLAHQIKMGRDALLTLLAAKAYWSGSGAGGSLPPFRGTGCGSGLTWCGEWK